MIEAAATNLPVATLIAEAQRMRFIPRMLPGVPVLIAEFTVFNWMERLSVQYGGVCGINTRSLTVLSRWRRRVME
jgi:hypothetical protein